MALVEPLIGHLLSKYKETVLEGLSKIRNAVQADDEQGAALATAITQQEEALQAIRATLLKSEYFVPTVQALTAVLTHLAERGSRVALVREVLRGDCAALFRKTLATLSDASLSQVIAAFQFLTAAVRDAPLLVLARLRSPADVHASSSSSISNATTTALPRRADVPLQLAAFRLQLTYGQRRLRLVRLGFLVQLITSPMHNAVAETICSHGVLTHLLEDAAELLREGTSAGVACSLDALRVVRERFVQSREIASEQKRRVLLAQRHVFRLLVRALEFDPVADHAAGILYAIVDETIESPADYASTRVEALEDHGMPNYLLFFLLRQLRPKANARMAELVLYILQRAPDLIRPYFIRVSGHLAEEGSSHGVAPTTARVAVINLMTRAFLSPMPYHLAAVQVRLETVAAKTSTFYAMCPRDVADEICPAWIAEYVHRLINGSTNLLLLTLAMQLTQAALTRAKRVLRLVQAAQRAAEKKTSSTAVHNGEEQGASEVAAVVFTEADLAALHGSDDAEAEVWDTYNAQVRHHLQAALPSREEFWHRMTQQLHRSLITTASASASTATSAEAATARNAALTKVHVVTQRMLLLMKSYVDVFDVRVPWLSAVPAFLPDLRQIARKDALAPSAKPQKATAFADKAGLASQHPITVALLQHNDILRPWPAASVAILCELLVASHQRRVPMVKLHHMNMSQAQGIGEWPLLLSILLWVTHHHHHHRHQCRDEEEAGAAAQVAEMSVTAKLDNEAAQERRAVGWAAKLLLWTVHSVSIHSTCTMAEAYLWLSCLTPNTVPVFLHVVNHLLMRSLSKAADRVTQELREARFGVLVAAAEHFIDRTREKQLQKNTAETSRAAASEMAGPRAGGGGKPPNHNGGRKGRQEENLGMNLWGTHLHAALGEFEGVLDRVRQRWPRRRALLYEADAREQADARAAQVTPQQCIDVLVLTDRHGGGAAAAAQAAASAAQQLRTFTRTLQSPVLPLSENEAEMTLLTKLHGVAQDENDDVQRISAALGLSDPVRQTTPRWYAMASVCWHIAGRLLASLNRQASATLNGTEGAVAAARAAAAVGLVRSVLTHRRDVEAVFAAASGARDGSTTGLLVLLLSCLRVLLDAATGATTTTASPTLLRAEGEDLGALCLSHYTGGLGVQDRLCYAVCLSSHYLLHSTEPTAEKEAGETSADERKVSPSPQARRHEGRQEKRDGEEAAAADEPQLRCVFYGASVPQALVQHRFLLDGHTASAFRTAEVEMLSWHLDTLTEEDMTRMALCVSSRLHNGLVRRRPLHNACSSSSSVDAAEDLLCAVYPELNGVDDVDVADLDQLTSSDVLDLRYIVPLLHRVAALPPAYLEHLSTGRVIPLLLKGLTSIDAQLRAAAAATLATLYVPKGALRIVVGVARLKLHQLDDGATLDKQPQCQLPDTASLTAKVPRLPTPLAVFLITAVRPLGRYEDAMHHHLIHFLLHIDAALSAPMPFAQWTTAPPLSSVSVPLMLEKQEALQQRTHQPGGGGRASSVAQVSAADVAQELRRGIPPQLNFVLRLLRHACEVPQDGAALLASDSVSGLMLLCDLLTASDTMRASYVGCLLDMCTRSAQLTQLFARQGNALVWCISFLWELCKEYGMEAPYLYGGCTFTNTLKLLRVLCVATLRAGATCVSAALTAQVEESLRQLRSWVVAAHVTARDTLDAFDEMIDRCERALSSVVTAAAHAAAAVTVENCAEDATTSAAAAVSAQTSAAAGGKRRREKASGGAVVNQSAALPKRVKAERAE
ncbi:Ribosome 60S biogenesis N-terminal [Lotmaria passim]